MLFIGFTHLTMHQISKIFHVKYEDNTTWLEHYNTLKRVVRNTGLALQYNKNNSTFSFGIGATVLKHTRITVSETNKYLSSLEQEFIEIMSRVNNSILEVSPIVFDHPE